MRIIPKKTKVTMEFFKGVDMPDVAVGMVGVIIDVALFVSNFPFKYIAMAIVTVLFIGLIAPFDNEKMYMTLLSSLKYMARPRTYPLEAPAAGSGAKKASGGVPLTVPDVTPFTGISDNFIEYGGEYYGAVVEVPSIEFRFMTASKQNNVIDRLLGASLRTVTGSGACALVKIDRPVIYDSFIETEYKKIAEIKKAYLNGLITDDELTSRVAVIYERIEDVKVKNFRDKVYRPFHYFVFFDKDKRILQEQAQTLVGNMSGADMECKVLNGRELAVFLKYNYTLDFDEREADSLRPEQYMKWILPEKITFTARTVKYGDLITHNLHVTDYPTTVGNAWGHILFNTMNTRVIMKISPVERYKAVRRVDRAIDELRSRQETTGKASKQIELASHLDTLSELLVLLQGDNEVLFDVNIYVTIYDYELSRRALLTEKGSPAASKAGAPSIKKQIRRQFAEQGFKTADMLMQQFEAYASAHVSKYDAQLSKSRGIHSGSVAAAFPFVYKVFCDKNGFQVGISDGVPAFVNFFARDRERVNSNMVIIGKSGSGKSYATKTLLSNLAAEDSKIFILDPENEYFALAHHMKGKIIDVGSATQGRLNPFHIITSAEDDEDGGDARKNTSFNMHMQFLEEFMRQILPGIDSDAIEYLNNIIVRMYEARGIDGETDLSTLAPSDFPVFDDLYEKILNDFQTSSGEYTKTNMRILLNYVAKFASGGRNSALWNGEATISTNENFIVFNFQSMLANKNTMLANAQMLLVLKWLDNEIIKNRDYNIKYGANRKVIVVIDEAHVFIDEKYPIALDFMHQLAKRIRKYNGMQIIITQNIKDFVGTEEIARKSTAIINACQYSFIFPLSPNDMHDLCKLYEKAGAISESEQEEIVNNGRGRAFVVTSPSSRTCIDIIATDQVQKMFNI